MEIRTLTAQELMLGDWVLSVTCKGEAEDPKPRRIEGIGESVVLLRPRAGVGMEPYGYEDIQPVPLTVEILERNGFMPTGGGDNSWMLTTPFGIPELRYHIYVGFKAGYIDVFAAHPNTGSWRKKNHTLLEVCGMYVHELQHALRLCGIDKEIEL